LPILSWREVLKALLKIGFHPVRQRGSHIVVESSEGKSIVIPRHEEIRRGTLLAIIEQSGLAKDTFLKLLE